MIKLSKLILIFFTLGSIFICTGKVSAEPQLDLWIEHQRNNSDLVIEIYRENTGFGLGGLSYNLELSEPLDVIREYSNYGWIAGDGFWDNSNPVDGVSSTDLSSVRFDTTREPTGSEFTQNTSGIVEVLTFPGIFDTPEHWIYFDLADTQATDGSGAYLETDLGGSINIIEKQGMPENHTYGVYVPEPSTLILFSFGSLLLLRKKKK